MIREIPLLALALSLGCARSETPAPAGLSDFGKQVLLTMQELRVQPGAAAFMKDLDADDALTQSLASGLDEDAKSRLQKLVEKHESDPAFRAAVLAAGGDPAACGAPKPDEKDPVGDCEKKPLNLLDP